MEPVIHSSHGALTLVPTLPKGWKGGILCGSQPYSYQGPLGTATLQKFGDEKFSICYVAGHFLQKTKLFWKEQPLLRLQYVLEGNLHYGGREEKWTNLCGGQVNGVWAPARETAADLAKGKLEILQIAFQPEVVQELLPGFPNLQDISENLRQWIGEDRQKDIYEMLNVPFNETAARFLYRTKIREHLFKFLLPLPENHLDQYADEIKERIYKVDRKILKNLKTHYTTKELADFVKMPEGKLIALFKEIIGVSMFDRYKEAKLQKAKKYLLETDIQVKVMYEMVGYSSYTGFVEAFKDRFGISPLQFRKKFRPF